MVTDSDFIICVILCKRSSVSGVAELTKLWGHNKLAKYFYTTIFLFFCFFIFVFLYFCFFVFIFVYMFVFSIFFIFIFLYYYIFVLFLDHVISCLTYDWIVFGDLDR